MDGGDPRSDLILRGVVALERIAAVLECLVPDDGAPETEAPCPHPVEARIAFGVTNGREDWQCGVCGYRTVAEVRA